MKHNNYTSMRLLLVLFAVLTPGYGNFFDTALEWVDTKLLNCRLMHCCNDFQFNSQALASELEKKVHGQHLVVKNLVNILRGHYFNPDPSHALVLSFHGWTGCGKNFVSQIIAKHVFKYGSSSKHVKQFMTTHDFPHASRIEQYKDYLTSTIRSHVARCPRAIFIFDEIDKMPAGLIDVIRPFLERLPNLGGVDYRQSTFIFLSNTGAKPINQITLEHMKNGLVRENLPLSVLEQALSNSAYNEEEGGLWHTSLIELNLITAFIPFLPLTREHVARCIQDEFRRYGLMPNQGLISEILGELHYWPDQEQIFSISGCKRISQKVDVLRFSMRSDL